MGSLVATAVLIICPVFLANAASTSLVQTTEANLPPEDKDFLTSPISVKTESYFLDQEELVTEEIPFEIEYTDDPESEYGLERVVTAGVPGTAVKTYLVSYWNGEEVWRTLANTETTPPQNEVVARGTKIIWKEMATSGGPIRYWRTLNVRATSYDANCLGCTGRTYSGTEVTHGVCATDPSVISLGTYFYVPGYGSCHAEDIGGAIKGNRIDLGFADVRNGWWSTRYVDIYLTTGAPE